jgi:nucleotide-binding universal stress UspA family protein
MRHSNSKEDRVKILLAVDGSEASARAAAKLAETISWFKETPQIEVLTVHLPVPMFAHMGVVVTQEMLDRHYSEESAAAMAPARRVLDEAGVKYTAKRAVGPIAETLVDHAQRHGFDMIYMGTRGMTALSNMMMGSIATKVVHLSPIPVVLVR